MDNPCKYCDKANMKFVDDLEYGCDKPCSKAKEFYKNVGCQLEKLLDRVYTALNKSDWED